MNWERLDFRPPGDQAVSHEKVKLLNRLAEQGSFDHVLLPILERLYSLPVTSTESCSGHLTGPDLRQIVVRKDPYLCIVDDEEVSEADMLLQRHLRDNLDKLHEAISLRLGEGVVTVRLLGYNEELPDPNNPAGYRMQRHDLIRTLHEGYPYTLNFTVTGAAEAASDGFPILAAIWEEFCHYIDSIRGQNRAIPSFLREQFALETTTDRPDSEPQERLDS